MNHLEKNFRKTKPDSSAFWINHLGLQKQHIFKQRGGFLSARQCKFYHFNTHKLPKCVTASQLNAVDWKQRQQQPLPTQKNKHMTSQTHLHRLTHWSTRRLIHSVSHWPGHSSTYIPLIKNQTADKKKTTPETLSWKGGKKQSLTPKMGGAPLKRKKEAAASGFST